VIFKQGRKAEIRWNGESKKFVSGKEMEMKEKVVSQGDKNKYTHTPCS